MEGPGLYSGKRHVGFTHTRVHTADRRLLLLLPPTTAADTPEAPHRSPQARVSGSASARGPQPNPRWISDRYAPLRARCLDGQAHTCPVRKHSEPGPLTGVQLRAGGGGERPGVSPTPGTGARPSETGPGAHCLKEGSRPLQIQTQTRRPCHQMGQSSPRAG